MTNIHMALCVLQCEQIERKKLQKVKKKYIHFMLEIKNKIECLSKMWIHKV